MVDTNISSDDAAIADALDDGKRPKGGRKASPERMCIVTRERADPARLLRFALAPDDSVVADLAGRLPGRGVWVSLSRDVLRTAIAKQAFARGFKCSVRADATLLDQVEAGLRQRALSGLALANKSGAVVAGMDKVEAAIGAGGIAGLIAADDASDDGRGKLERRYLRACETEAETPRLVHVFGRMELGLALGRSNVVHAAIRATGAALHFLNETERLELYLAGGASTAKT